MYHSPRILSDVICYDGWCLRSNTDIERSTPWPSKLITWARTQECERKSVGLLNNMHKYPYIYSSTLQVLSDCPWVTFSFSYFWLAHYITIRPWLYMGLNPKSPNLIMDAIVWSQGFGFRWSRSSTLATLRYNHKLELNSVYSKST